MIPYAEKLKDPRWQKRRLEILERDEFRCKACENEKSTLHVHHRIYRGDPWDAADSELETVCDECHLAIKAIGNALRWADVKNLKGLNDAALAYNAANEGRKRRPLSEIWIEATYAHLAKNAKTAAKHLKA